MEDRYTKKPVTIHAREWTKDSIQGIELGAWISSNGGRCYSSGDNLIIVTLEGDMTASPGDMIIQGVKGEFYPCKPDIFKETYDRYTEQQGTGEDIHRGPQGQSIPNDVFFKPNPLQKGF